MTQSESSRKEIQDINEELKRIMAAMHHRMRALAAKHGLTPPQIAVLKRLKQKGKMTLKELALDLGVTRAISRAS